MFEKVNPCHPDKVADRIAGAIVDLCYAKSEMPKVACEVLIGHGECNIQIETSEQISAEDCEAIVRRIAGEGFETRALIAPQDAHLSDNQTRGLRCGDNGIFRGCPPTEEQRVLTAIAATIYGSIPYDGKYIIQQRDGQWDLTVCQSHLSREQEPELRQMLKEAYNVHLPIINPLGPWTGGINVDCGCTNRKLGSDMGDGVTGGGLMGKDLSKADVSVNIACYLKAVASGQVVTSICSIGDENVTFTYADGRKETERFADIVEQARLYILTDCGGSFERFAEWGLIRPLDQE